MKKLLILALTAVMVLAFSAAVSAATVSLDYILGTYDANGWGTSGDAPTTSISLDLPFDNFKIALEYGTGTWQDGTDYDFDYTEVKFGYRIISADLYNLYITLIYNSYNVEWNDYNYFYGYSIGIDYDYAISDNSSFNATVDYSLSGQDDADYDAVLILLKLKYSYYFTDNVGMEIGYYYSNVYWDATDNDWTFSGFSLGVSFKF